MDAIGKSLVFVLIGGLVVLGLVALLVAALTPTGFGAALLAVVIGVPGYLLLGAGLRAIFPRRRRRKLDGSRVEVEPDPERGRRLVGGVFKTLLGLGTLGFALTLVSSLAFGPAVLWVLAGYVGLWLALTLLSLLLTGLYKLGGD